MLVIAIFSYLILYRRFYVSLDIYFQCREQQRRYVIDLGDRDLLQFRK